MSTKDVILLITVLSLPLIFIVEVEFLHYFLLMEGDKVFVGTKIIKSESTINLFIG